MFKNIAGNESLQFDCNLKAQVDALTNLAKLGWQGDGLVSLLCKKPFFGPICVG